MWQNPNQGGKNRTLFKKESNPKNSNNAWKVFMENTQNHFMMKTLVHKYIINFQTMGLVVAREAENNHISISIGHSWEKKWAEPSLLLLLDEMHEEVGPWGPSIRHHCTEFRSTCSLLVVDQHRKAFSDILQILSKSAAQPALGTWRLCSHGGLTQHPTFSKLSSPSSFHWVPLILGLFRDLGLWFKSYPLLLPRLFLDFKFCGSHRKFQIPWLNPVSSAVDPVSRAFQCCEPVSGAASAMMIPNVSPCNSKYWGAVYLLIFGNF